MTLISCNSNCIYEENGYCNLNQAAAVGVDSETGCIHYIPKEKPKYKAEEKKKEQASCETKNPRCIE